jgi:prepilin-type N-terminal cleavage/methylation domain-containing protein
MAVQLEVKRGFTLLELLTVLAISGILICALSGMLFAGNKDKQCLDITFNSLLEQGTDLLEQTLRPHYIEILTEDDTTILKLVMQEGAQLNDVRSLVCSKGIFLVLENCNGYQLDGVNPIFPISIFGKKTTESVAVFKVNGEFVEYRF